MIFDGSTEQAEAILRAMAVIARADNDGELTPSDELAIRSAATIIFRLDAPPDPTQLPSISPEELAATLGHRAGEALVPLVVMATVDGTLRSEGIELARSFAGAAGVNDSSLDDLDDLVRGHVAEARADMLRRNRQSITGEWVQDTSTFGSWLMPYREHPDPALTDRYRALAELPAGTFGHEFAAFYAANGFGFPGEPESPAEAFTTPHDSAHVLSRYDTSVQGELLVSTFTAGMHRVEGLAGHILPVIVSWHLGIPLTELAGSATGALDPRKLWVAWSRGDATTGDTFDPGWDFWAHVDQPLDDIRRSMGVPPLDPTDAADGHYPSWYRPTA